MSRLIQRIPEASKDKTKPVVRNIFLLRGSKRVKLDIDGNEASAEAADGKTGEEDKPARRTVPFTPTIASDQQ